MSRGASLAGGSWERAWGCAAWRGKGAAGLSRLSAGWWVVILLVVAACGSAGRMPRVWGGGVACLADTVANPGGVVGSLHNVVQGIPAPIAWTHAGSQCKEVWSA